MNTIKEDVEENKSDQCSDTGYFSHNEDTTEFNNRDTEKYDS